MLDVIEKLLTLQDRDQRLRSFQSELNHLPEERKAREKQIADSAARLDQGKLRAKGIEVEKRNFEVEAQAKRDLIARYRQQQLQTRKDEEYANLAPDIEAAEKIIASVEDRELDLMEELEKLTPQLATAEKLHADERSKLQNILDSLESKKQPGSARQRTQKRSPATRGRIDDEVLSLYEHLFRPSTAPPFHPRTRGLLGCHMKVTAQTIVQVRAARQIIHCPQCGRILYMPE
jgi:predicted  nucleic acid-binding Zn-ribbon protein